MPYIYQYEYVDKLLALQDIGCNHLFRISAVQSLNVWQSHSLEDQQDTIRDDEMINQKCFPWSCGGLGQSFMKFADILIRLDFPTFNERPIKAYSGLSSFGHLLTGGAEAKRIQTS